MARIESRLSGTISASAIAMPKPDSRNATSSRIPVESIRPASSSDSSAKRSPRSSRNRKLSSMNLRIFRSISIPGSPSGDRIGLRGIANVSVHVDEGAVPQLCGQNSQKRGVVAESEQALAAAFLDELVDRVGVEIAGRGDRRSRQRVPDMLGRTGREEAPALRRAIRLLGALDDALRQQGARALAQDVLFAQTSQLELRRYACRKLHHPVIEEREAALDRMSHRHAVALRGKDVAGEQVRRFQVLRLRQPLPACELRRQACSQFAHRIVIADFAAQLGGKELLGGCRSSQPRQVREQRIVRLLEPGAEEGLQIGLRLAAGAGEIRIEAPGTPKAPAGP